MVTLKFGKGSFAAAFLMQTAAGVQDFSKASVKIPFDVDFQQRNLLSKREGIKGTPFQPDDGVDQHKIRVTVNHLAKAGGTFVHDIVAASLPKDRLTWEREGDGITVNESKENFVIGMVRNPLNYYVSLWAYTSDRGHCCFRNSIAPAMQDSVFGQDAVLGTTLEDRVRFRRWLRMVSTSDLGLMSMRFYGSYLNFGDGTLGGGVGARAASTWEKGSVDWVLQSRARHLLGLPTPTLPGLVNISRSKSETVEYRRVSRIELNSSRAVADLVFSMSRTITENLKTLLQEMRSASGFGERAVNCWMYTERIVPDLKTCLEHYADICQQYEHNETSLVDWERFNEEVQSANHNEALPHVPCEDFYDEDTREFVLQSDAAIFDAFGYQHTCS